MGYDRLVSGNPGANLSDERRCVWIKVNTRRCGQPRVDTVGATLCRWHEEQLATRVQRWNVAENVPSFTVEQHLEMELRLSWVQIRELEFQVLDLGLSLEAWHHDATETEERTSAEPKNEYVSSKRAAIMGAHPVLVQYLKEREHHMQIIRMCVNAGIAAKQVAVVERYVDSIVAGQMDLAAELGHDPNDPLVRAAVSRVLRKQVADLQDVVGQEVKQLLPGTGTED